MKMSLKEYRNLRLNQIGGFRKFLIYIKIFKLVITDQNVWKNNSDYYDKIKINIYNPLSYFMLLVYIPLAFLINGCNPDSYRYIKKELKKQFKK
jgi:hypothetical protein